MDRARMCALYIAPRYAIKVRDLASQGMEKSGT